MSTSDKRTLTADDYVDIARLYGLYAHGNDTYDADAVAAIFTQECVWESPSHTTRGRVAVRDKVLRERGPEGPGPLRRHQVTDILLESVPGREDIATGRAYWAYLIFEGGAMVTKATGRFEDEFSKVGGNWLISQHKVRPDRQAT